MENRQVEGKRLTAGGPGRDEHVLLTPGGCKCIDLMGVEPGNTPARERLSDIGMECLGNR